LGGERELRRDEQIYWTIYTGERYLMIVDWDAGAIDEIQSGCLDASK
jgi:hypothetical protein